MREKSCPAIRLRVACVTAYGGGIRAEDADTDGNVLVESGPSRDKNAVRKTTLKVRAGEGIIGLKHR